MPVSAAGGDERNATVVDDGAGGVFVAWLDARSGQFRVYAQHLDAAGATQWGPAGVALNAAPSGTPDLAPDGVGGVFVTWSDTRGATSSDVYLQRLSSGGTPMWTANGVALAATASAEAGPKVLGDGAGGALVSWTSDLLAPRTVFAQRVNGLGAELWSAGGVHVLERAGVMAMTTDGAGGVLVACINDSSSWFAAQRVTSSGQLPWGATGSRFAQFPNPSVTWGEFPTIIADGQGGAIVAWYGGTQSLGDKWLYAQRLDATGATRWSSGNVRVGAVDQVGQVPWIAPDGSGGAVLTWGIGTDLYAQRLNASGVMLWPAAGAPVCIAPDLQFPVTILPDGAGGAAVAWLDGRNFGGGSDVYAQHLDALGAAQWRPNGAPVFLERIGQRSPALVADGKGGALAAWMEEVNGIYEIRAQRHDAQGQPRGPIVVLNGVESRKSGPYAVTDGAGGAIIAWSEARSGADFDVYAQRLDSSAAVHWAADGLRIVGGAELLRASALCADGAGGAFVAYTTQTVGAQHVDANGGLPWGAGGALVSSASQSPYVGLSAPCVTPDGAGGAIVAWVDGRWYDTFCLHGCGTALFAQRIAAAGNASWTTNGVLLRSAINRAGGSPEIVADGTGGAFAVWEDGRSGGWTLFGQHMDAAGSLAWAADGMPLSSTVSASHPALVASAAGHAIFAWSDARSGTGFDLYAQHVGYPVVGLWSPGGVPLCTASGDQTGPVLAADGAGGAIAAWTDARVDPMLDVYAQRIGSDGTRLWTEGGVVVSDGSGGQTLPVVAPAPDGGGAIAWQDSRSGFAPVIGFQRLDPAGLPLWGAPPVAVDRPPGPARLALYGIRPNPARREFTASFSLPDAGPAKLEMFDVSGRRVASLVVGQRGAGAQTARLGPPGLPPGIYLVRLVHASGTRTTKAVLLP